MKVKIWGARGSIPTPLTSQSIREKIITALQGAKGVDLSDQMAVRAYADGLSPFVSGTVGGNTACVEVQADDQMIIVDAGSGIRMLGADLMSGPCGRGQGVIHLFLSHTHWDHIQGFPFFLPAFVPGNRIFIYSVHHVAQTLADQMKPATFPVSLDYMSSTIEFVPLVEGEKITLGNVSITNLCLPHPGRAYAYRFEHQGAVFVYASDAEYKHLDEAHLEPYLRFYSGADALVFDAQFTLRDSLSKIDWGHSSAFHGADIARRAAVKQLILFHHDPNSSDSELAGILDKTIAYQSQQGEQSTTEIIMGFEGLELDLSPTSSLRVHQLPDTEAAVLSLAGDFDERSVAEIRSRLIEVPSNGYRSEEGESPRRPNLVVDMAGIKRLSIAGLRALIDLRRQWEGSAILLSGLSPQVRRVIELANCLDFFAIYPTVQTALAALEAREALGLPGQSLKNRYRIEARLGESEMGVVFKATDTRLQRPVAIKVLSPSFSQSATARLLREAQRMARLNVPDIVSIFDWDEEQGLAYLVMEYVAGKTLRQVMDQAQQQGGIHQPPLDISVAIDILHALEYAHSKEIVHGNLKPENILISDGVKLTDFGLRWFEEGRRLTKVPLLISRSDYLAPEQILGEAVDARTDLYALGIILYELFTGQRPFEGEGPEILDQHLHQLPIPPRQLNPELSRSLEHLILKLLAKEPGQRYGSATQVRRVLLSLKRDPSAQGRVKKETGPLRMQVHQRQQKIIGRENQLARLATLWSLSRSGQGQIVLIAGEAGVGKTSLSKEVAHQAGLATVLIGQCGELEGSPPYQPFIEIGRDYLARTSLPEVQEQLGESAAVLANLIPEIHDLIPDLPALPPLDPEQERLRLMHGFTQFVGRAAASSPWLLMLDDLHWADPASLQMLHYLSRHLGEIPLLIVGTYRDVELDAGHALRELLRGLSRYPNYHHVALNRLDRDGVRQLLEGIWRQQVPDEWTTAIYQRTDGNPFYVEEVAQSLIDEGSVALRDGTWHFPPAVEVRLPQSIHDIVLRRVGRLSKASQDALRLAGVLGQQFSFTDLMAVAEQAEEQLLESLDEALERDLIRELDTGGTLSFSHTEIQQVIYEALSPLRRRALHRRAGLALEEWHASNLDAIAGQLAYHFIQAGDREKAFTYSLQAAQRAQSLHAHQDALSWYTQALGYLTDAEAYAAKRVELYEGLGAMLQMQARFTEAVATYTAMRAAAESIGDTAAQARAWRGLSWAHNSLGDHHGALECAQRAEHMARAAEAKIELAASIQGQGWAMYKMGDAESALAFGQQALELSRAINARNEMALSLNLLGAVSDMLGHYDQANLYWWEALALYREMGNRTRVGVILSNLGDTARMRGDYHTGVSLLQEALSIAREMENREGEMTYMNNLGGAWVGLGEYRAAEAELQQVIRMPEASRWGTLSQTYCFLAEACLRQGKLHEALEAARHALDLGQQRDRPEFIGAACRALGMVVSQFQRSSWETGDLDDAAAYFARSLDVFAEIGMDGERARTLREWAHYEMRQGDYTRGETMWQEALRLFEQLGMELEVERMQSSAE